MKSIRKAISVFLVMAMAISVLCIPGYAQGGDDAYAKLKEGTGYVAIGDSFARGFGASDHWKYQLYENEYYGQYECRNVDGSYPNLVADAFGLNAPNDIRDLSSQFWPVTHDAVSTAFILDLLGIDDGFRDEELIYSTPLISNRYKTDLEYFGDPLSMNFEGTGTFGKTGEIMSMRNMLENASLITIGLGQTDVIYRALLLGLYDADFSDSSKIPSIIANLIKMLYENYNRWKEIYPVLLDYIKEKNPDARVVLVGTMNPLQNAMLSEDILIPVGSVVNIVLDLINKYIRECAKKYGYMFVDISNVEAIPIEIDMALGDMLAMDLGGIDFALLIHPNANGYQQIARMIIAAVEEDLAKEAGASTDSAPCIKVDIGKFTDADFVAVDGRKVTNFSVDNHVLCIPCGTTDAKNLTVSVKEEDGTATLMSYVLKYDNGYSAHRMYLSHDFPNSIFSTVKAIVSVFVNLLKNIFTAK